MKGCGDTRVRPVEVHELTVVPGDVAGMEVAVDEASRQAAAGEPAAGVLAAPGELPRAPRPPRTVRRWTASAITQERIDPSLERVEPPVDEAVGEQFARELRRTTLQACKPAKELLVDVERRVPAKEVAEVRQQHPAPLGLDGQGAWDIAREPIGSIAVDRRLLDKEREPGRHLEVHVGAVVSIRSEPTRCSSA